MNYSVDYAGACITGYVRKNNEDNFWCDGIYLPKKNNGYGEELSGHLDLNGHDRFIAVFDGMGGEADGEAAAAIAAKSMDDSIKKGIDPERFLYIQNQNIVEYAAREKCGVCGCTAAVMQFGKKRAVCRNLGDSRIYRYQDLKLKQISVDHVDHNSRRKKPGLIQFLGIPETEYRIVPERKEIKYRDDDYFLICTDGVTDMIQEAELQKIFAEFSSVSEIRSEILRLLEARGAIDNATFFVCRLIGEKKGLFGWLNKRKGKQNV